MGVYQKCPFHVFFNHRLEKEGGVEDVTKDSSDSTLQVNNQWQKAW